MRTVQEIFDQAIHMMDAQNESTGSTMTADTKEYSLRTPNCLNRYINLVYPYSDTYVARTDGKRIQPLEQGSVIYNTALRCRVCKADWYPTIYMGAELDDDEPFIHERPKSEQE